MGSVLSSRGRTAPARESRGAGDLSPYRYPPPHGGVYFANHYYLGHKKFDTGEPEVFLFGDLQDINYLPAKPIKFPYKQPSKNHPLKTLRSYINIQRDSIKLVRVVGSTNMYSVQFTFDCDVACDIRMLTQVLDTASVDSLSQHESLAGPFKFSSGSEQVFNESGCCIDPASLLGSPHGNYDPQAGSHTVPIALVVTTSDNNHSHMEQTQVSLCTVDRLTDQNFSIKIIKQKLLVDGMELLLQELYGLENKLKPSAGEEEVGVVREESQLKSDDDNDEDDLGAECVICITENRDTLLLPCRHLCLCSSCAASLRYQSSNCPICRAPFRALLQIKALQPLDPSVTLDDDTVTGNPKYSVPGYELVPLLQALNGYQLEDTPTDPEDPPSCNLSPTTPTPLQETTTEFSEVVAGGGEVTLSSSSSSATGKVPWVASLPPSPCTSGQGDSEVTPANPSVVVEIEGEKFEEDALNCQACGSSVSSEASTKSTDNLLQSPNGSTLH